MPRHRNIDIKVRQYADGRWGFNDYSLGRLKKIRLKTKQRADECATDVSVALANGRSDLLNVSRTDFALFRQWQEKHNFSRIYGEVLADFAAAKRADKDLHGEYVEQLIRRANYFLPVWEDRPIGEIGPGEIASELQKMEIEPRNRNNARDALVTLWRFARDERGNLPMEAKTAAERVKRLWIKRATVISLYSPTQFHNILVEARPDFIPVFAIEGLAGIRTQEVRPTSRERKKDPLRWEDFHWRDGYIRIRPETAKTGEERLIPIQPALRHLLAPYRQLTGPIIDRSANEELKRIRKILELEPVRNGFRHSYGTYRNAIIHDIARVAEELGNTIRTAKARYVRPKFEKDARRWFKPNLPANVIKFQKVPVKAA